MMTPRLIGSSSQAKMINTRIVRLVEQSNWFIESVVTNRWQSKSSLDWETKRVSLLDDWHHNVKNKQNEAKLATCLYGHDVPTIGWDCLSFQSTRELSLLSSLQLPVLHFHFSLFLFHCWLSLLFVLFHLYLNFFPFFYFLSCSPITFVARLTVVGGRSWSICWKWFAGFIGTFHKFCCLLECLKYLFLFFILFLITMYHVDVPKSINKIVCVKP